MTFFKKSIISVILIIAVLCSSVLVACNNRSNNEDENQEANKGTSMFSVIGNGSITYYEPSEGVTGILASLKEGDILRYNDVVDLNSFDRDMPFIQFCTMPEIPGVAEAKRLKVILTDAQDDSNYIEIDIKKCSNGTIWDDVVSYFSVSFNGGKFIGLNRDENGQFEIIDVRDGLPHKYKAYIDNKYGTNMKFSMSGMAYASGVTSTNYGERLLGFMFDVAAQQLFLTESIDSDDSYYNELCADLTMRELYEHTFYGFTDGRVKIEIIPQEMLKPNFRLFVSKVGFNDVNKDNYNSYESSINPNIFVDLSNVSDNRIPSAHIGTPYQIFNATATDIFSDKIDVSVRVYFEQDGSDIEVVDGKFIPNKVGNYVIEYSAVNSFGNKTVNKINVSVLD